MPVKTTTDARRGGTFKGDSHAAPSGGIDAVVIEKGKKTKDIKVEGGEAIINKEATRKHWRKLSEINQSAGDGVPIGPPEGAESAQQSYAPGGTIPKESQELITGSGYISTVKLPSGKVLCIITYNSGHSVDKGVMFTVNAHQFVETINKLLGDQNETAGRIVVENHISSAKKFTGDIPEHDYLIIADRETVVFSEINTPKEDKNLITGTVSAAETTLKDLLAKKESLIAEKKAQDELKNYNEAFRIIEEVAVLDQKIRNENNTILVLNNGGTTTSFTDKKGAEHIDIPTFTQIKTDFISFNEETILTDPLPIYIPLIDEGVFSEKGFIFDTMRLDKDTYILATNGFKEYKVQSRKEEITGGKRPAEDYEQGYVIVTLDQLALISDYYYKKAKAVIESKAQERDKRNEDYYDKLPASTKEKYLMKEGYYKTLPQSVKKLVTEQDWNTLDLPGREKFYKPIARAVRKRLVSKLEENQMWTSFHQMYERFVNPEARPINKDGSLTEPGAVRAAYGTFGNPETFAYWRKFRYMMDWKIKDIKVQRQFESDIRAAAIETSFGESNTNTALKDQYGILVKRQNGEKIQPNEIDQIKKAWENINKAFGTLTGLAKDDNLKISHTGKTLVFASKAAGMYIPKMKTIAVSAKMGDMQFENIMAHETSHWIDNTLGVKTGHRYHSDDFESTAGVIADTLRRNMNGQTESDYYNSTKECFARAMEQYFAIETHGQDAMIIFNYSELDRIRPYFAEDFYVSKEVYDNKLKPLIKKFIEENKDFFKYDTSVDIAVSDTSLKDVVVMDEETYLSINGASRQGLGDAALHKNKGNNSDKTWSRIVNDQAVNDRELLEKRDKLRQEYNAKVAAGEIRPLTREEKLIETAQGHEDLASTHSARRILTKKGIDWDIKKTEIMETAIKKYNKGDAVLYKDVDGQFTLSSEVKNVIPPNVGSGEPLETYELEHTPAIFTADELLSPPSPKFKVGETVSIMDDPQSNNNFHEVVAHEGYSYNYGWETKIRNISSDKTVTMFENLLEASTVEAPVIKEKSVTEYKKDLNELIDEQLKKYEDPKNEKHTTKKILSEISHLLGIYWENIVSKNPQEFTEFLQLQKKLPSKIRIMAEYASVYEFAEVFKSNLVNNLWDLIPDEYKDHNLPKRIGYKPVYSDPGLHQITKDFVSHDDNKLTLMGVHFDKEGITTTDANKMLFLAHSSEQKEATYCLTKDCLKANDENDKFPSTVKYPDYKRVVPDHHQFASIHTESLIKYLKTIIAIRYFHPIVEEAYIIFGETEMAFNAYLLLSGVEVMQKLGYDQIDIGYSHPNRAVTLCKKGELKNVPKFTVDFALIMPIMMGNKIDYTNGTMYFNMDGECVSTKGIADKSCINPVHLEREKNENVLVKANEVLAKATEETAKQESIRSAQKTADKLISAFGKINDKLFIKSGGDVYNSKELQKKLKLALDNELPVKFTYPLSLQVFDVLEDENFHLLNSYLSMSGAFGEERKQKEFEFLDSLKPESKSNFLDPKLFRPEVVEAVSVKPSKAVLEARLRTVKRMFEKKPAALLKARLRVIENMLKNPEKFCSGGAVHAYGKGGNIAEPEILKRLIGAKDKSVFSDEEIVFMSRKKYNDWNDKKLAESVKKILYPFTNKYGKGGTTKLKDHEVYIEFLNSEKNFKKDKKTFKGTDAYNDAVKWGRENMENFHIDMVNYVTLPFGKGGSIPNNYEGKTAEQVWDEWDREQRLHFIVDHSGLSEEVKGGSISQSGGKIEKVSFDQLSEEMRTSVEIHVNSGQYGKGGVPKAQEGVDLFEDYEKQPKNVQKILKKYSEGFEEGDYAILDKALKDLNKIGYTFEYYLDGLAYDLRKIGEKGRVTDSIDKLDKDSVKPFGKGGPVKNDMVVTKDGKQIDRKNPPKNHIFHDENGGKYKCLGYKEKLDDCVYLNMQTKKKVVGCVKGFYFEDPIRKADKKVNILKFPKVMRDFIDGSLKTTAGKKVTNRREAIAIALNEAGLIKK